MAGSIARGTNRDANQQPADQFEELRRVAERSSIDDFSIEREGDKLVVTGRARYQLDRDILFDALQQFVEGWESEVLVDLAVERSDVHGFHTVEEGETLASIAERHLGSASREMEIFEANRDRMNDPSQILPGQQLLIPRR